LAVALTAAGSAIAQTPSPVNAVTSSTPTSSGDTGKTQRRHGKKMDKRTKVQTNPNAALIEYLGEYDDAADGLDPMGLADPDAMPSKKSDGGKG